DDDAVTTGTAESQPVAAGPKAVSAPKAATVNGQIVVGLISDTEAHEAALWNNAAGVLSSKGLKQALDVLFSASCSVSSVRSKNRYRLLMAKLCLQANRPDLARPIAEELNTLLEELGLERWESPVWVGDVLGALYRCLIQAEEGSDDYYRAEEIFKKMCTIDLTKALQHRQS
ncbi:type VI secretion system domain-containing protein, partial [Desulfosarcina cetonica]|uniref:type VI secretion system domain-containing protein n=1 Tax=Desulfosarcina cetonica TaxID=90730 RepID=UPI001C452202